jgi:hypothetical protein
MGTRWYIREGLEVFCLFKEDDGGDLIIYKDVGEGVGKETWTSLEDVFCRQECCRSRKGKRC